MLGASFSVFGSNSIPHRPSSHPVSPLPPCLSPNLSPYMYPHPHPLPRSPSANLQRPFRSRHPSGPSPLYPALSSHHPLPQYLPSSPPQGRSSNPPLPPLKASSLTPPLPNLLNQVVRAWVNLRVLSQLLHRSGLLAPRGSQMKRFG